MSGLTIHFDRLKVAFGDETVLDEVSCTVEKNRLNALIGPNGAGKTTLLHALLNFVPYTGSIRYDGIERAPRIGYVPQRVELERGAPVTVADFLASGLAHRPVWTGRSSTLTDRIRTALRDVGIPERRSRRMDELSGGEFQRVLLAQALLREPDLLILDEPNTGVDIIGNQLFCSLVEQVHEQRQVTTLLVTHDLGVVADHANRVIGLNGNVVFEGETSEVLNSDNLVRLFGPHSDRWSQPHSHTHEPVHREDGA
ncbi:metal ABC transporter ATP-binding protein [bacterium]|nr:metal ABC transporter ATP-binding protein [bacterium]